MVLTPEASSYDALRKHFDELFDLGDDFKSEFLRSISEEIVSAMTESDFTNKYTEYDRELLPSHVLDKLKPGWKAFRLEVPNYGDGGTTIQNAATSLPDFSSDELLVVRMS